MENPRKTTANMKCPRNFSYLGVPAVSRPRQTVVRHNGGRDYSGLGVFVEVLGSEPQRQRHADC